MIIYTDGFAGTLCTEGSLIMGRQNNNYWLRFQFGKDQVGTVGYKKGRKRRISAGKGKDDS